jgi:hypothetical protein
VTCWPTSTGTRWQRAPLLDFGALGLQLGLDGFVHDGEALLLELVASGQRIGARSGDALVQIGDQARLGQLLIALGGQFGFDVFRFDLGGAGLLGHQLALDADAQVGVFGFRATQGHFGVQGLLLELRVAQFKNDGVGLDWSAGQGHASLNAAIGSGRDPAHLHRNQGARATHLAQH